jgi:hypothetical protein
MKTDAINWIERLGKWRSVFAGWQLGTRPNADPECAAVRDHRELSMALRADANALAALLIAKGVFTAEEFTTQLQDEAQYLCREYERRFPGFKAADYGMDINVAIARDTMAGWRP